MPGNEKLPPLEQNSPLLTFLKQDAVAACLLLLSAVIAMVCANSAVHEWYHNLWHQYAGFSLGDFALKYSLHHWVNDGLMSIFFFLVGLEIKRELLVGELASIRKATLPAAAALGGMIFPALIYTVFNFGKPTAGGWGVPMATDIAFATGCLALLGRRIPASLSVFLMALAIVDDLGSVTVIALFYSDQIALRPLIIGTAMIVLSYGLARKGVRATWVYVAIGAVVWFEFLQSGVHATIAGVLLAFTIPPDAQYETPNFFGRMSILLRRFNDAEDFANPLLVNGRQQQIIRSILRECHHVEAPLQRIEHLLHPFSVFLIMPVFAFANSGVHLDWGEVPRMMGESVTLGIIFGLILGKQIGIMSFCWVTVKLGWAELPKGVKWIQIYGVSWLAAIGFTMALFVNELAFKNVEDAEIYLAEGKVGTFTASIIAGIVGVLILRAVCPLPPQGAESEAPRKGH
ncbi:MAG: Na(+)/H(+) antiporter NhaA [Candidatus Hydrogenedentota bacterium]